MKESPKPLPIATRLSASTFEHWTFTVVDPNKVPREWLIVDEKAIGQAVRRKDNPLRELAGVEITCEKKARY